MWIRALYKGFTLSLLLCSLAMAQGMFGGGGNNTGIGGGNNTGIGGWGNNNNNNKNKDGIPGTGNTVIRFLVPWTNTSAKLLVDGDTVTMTKVNNYCGWFQAKAEKPASGFYVGFKQTIGSTFIGADGPVENALAPDREILLDSIAALSDTLWIIGNPSGVPELYSSYPQRLGECPVRTISVMMFDWLHGSDGDGYISTSGLDGEQCGATTNAFGGRAGRRDTTEDTTPKETEYCNGAKNLNPKYSGSEYLPAYQVSNDFGSGGCSASPMRGMVETALGANGVPVRATNFPANCKLTDYLNYWFLPAVIGKDAAGKQYTNATCRDLELNLDNEGYWLGEKNSSSPEKGLFFLDDFEYLDEAKTVKNIMFDNLNGSGGNHNFGFTMKFQAKFEYVPGQFFEFKGDDDVWVFINNKLVVDIGGQHGEVSGSVDLDTLGLVAGQTYQFHIFYVERHTTSSNFKMRTSMDLHTDASIFLTNVPNGSKQDYNVWSINKKDALSCDFSNNDLGEVDTTGGPSNYRLIGGNLGETGVMLDSIGKWFEGIFITSDTTFSIDSAAIVENYALAPGHYELEITLKKNPSQMTRVHITVPQYAIPTLVFANDKGKVLGKDVNGDTLQIGPWAFESYKVNVQFLEDWAQVSIYNSNLTLNFSNPMVDILDSTGKKISKVTLDENGKASFYVMANAGVVGATLQVKGAATSTAIWMNLNFQEPPIPRVVDSKLYDRNGDGRGDSLYVHFDRELAGKNRLDSMKFAFGESMPMQKKFNLSQDKMSLTLVSSGDCREGSPCGFGSQIFTGSKDGEYTGTIENWFTYIENGKEYHFHIAGEPLGDGVNPIVVLAQKSITSNGHVLSLTFSEALTDSCRKYYQRMFRYLCIRAGAPATPENPIGVDNNGESSKMELLFNVSTIDAVVPSVGDSVGFTPGTEGVVELAQDMSGNKAHRYSPMVRITGDQDITITGGNVVPLTPDNPNVSPDLPSTSPTLISNLNLDAKDISDQMGVQGHLVGFDVAELLSSETTEEIKALDNLISTLLTGSTEDTTYDVTEITPEQSATQLISAIAMEQVSGFTDAAVTLVNDGSLTAENYKSLLSGEDLMLFEEYVIRGVEASRDTNVIITKNAGNDVAALFQQIINGEISEGDLRDNGVSQEVIDAIKSGRLTANNLDQFRDGNMTLIAPEDVSLSYETKYFSHLGHYVAGSSGTISCMDTTVYGKEGCLVNSGNIFLAWNMRADDGRLAATGVYIARLHVKIKVGHKVVSNITRDLLWGVRRGQVNEIDVGEIVDESQGKTGKRR